MTEDHRRVDQIRQQLRSLGYLDAGVDRFVLGPVTNTRSPLMIAVLAAARVGLLGGILLGPAAAVGLNGRLPGLVTGARDAVVIALYLALLFGAGVWLLTVAASFTVAWFAGHRTDRSRRVSRAAGRAIAVGCLVYLTLWWRTANAGFGWSAPVWTAFALGVAVVISLLLGSVATSAAFAVAIAGAPAHAGSRTATGHHSKSRRSWPLTLLAGIAAFAGAAALLLFAAPRTDTEQARIPLAVVSSGVRVRLIAIDGLDLQVLNELAREGRVPALSRALAVRTRLQLDWRDAGRDPARAWTTVATGQPPEAHGVEGLETRRIAGLHGALTTSEGSPLGSAIHAATDLLRLTRPSVASGNERRVKTMWEVASDAGLRTVVVNWWATWPATAEDQNVIVSDRAVLRLEHGGPLDAEIAPASLYNRLEERWSDIKRDAEARASAAAASLNWHGGDRAVLERSANLDALQLALLNEVSTGAPDFSVVYLPGLDIAQNALLGPHDAALAPSDVTSRVRALGDYQVFLDRLLTDVLTPHESEAVIVVTEPGRIAEAGSGLLGIEGDIAAKTADSPSTPLGTGPGSSTDRESRTAARELEGTARPTDVAATVLHVLGLPISRELAGRPLLALLDPSYVRRYPIRFVDAYGAPAIHQQYRAGRALDQEMIDRLRSLGYVK